MDNEYIQTPELRDELHRLQKWWNRTCTAVNLERADPALQDGAQYAVEWCISLAQEVADSERLARDGNAFVTPQLEMTRRWVWERFEHLEKGLMSNGIERS